MTRRASISEILGFLGLERTDVLEQLRREGLFEEDWLDPGAAEELRVAASLMRELGVNPAGVEVALHLRRRMRALESLAERLMRDLLEEGGPPGPPNRR